LTPYQFRLFTEGVNERMLTQAWLAEALHRQEKLKPLSHYMNSKPKKLSPEEVTIRKARLSKWKEILSKKHAR